MKFAALFVGAYATLAGAAFNETELSLGVEGMGGVARGLVKGLLGNSKNFQQCGADVAITTNTTKKLMKDIRKHKIEAVLKDLSEIVVDVKPALDSCGHAAGDLKVFMKVLEGVKTPGDLYRKIKKNGLDNDATIVSELERMAKVCTFAEPNGYKCGENLGKITRQLIVGTEHMELELETQNGNIISGLMKGLLGNSKNFKACAGEIGDVTNATKSVVMDIRKRHIEKALQDMSKLLMTMKPALAACGEAAGDLKVFLHVLDGVKTPGDLYQKLKKNGLANDEKIVSEMEQLAKVCTFAAPSAYKCGLNMGKIARQIVVGAESTDLIV